MTTVVFSHGQESGPWGTKIRSMAELATSMGLSALSVDYQGIADPTERVDKLLHEAGELNDPIILVGSSMGGHVATAAAEGLGALGLFVLAPAFYMPGYEALTPAPPAIPFCIVHGWRDTVVPVENSIRYASECHATLHLVDGDHRLTDRLEDIRNLLRFFIEQVDR